MRARAIALAKAAENGMFKGIGELCEPEKIVSMMPS